MKLAGVNYTLNSENIDKILDKNIGGNQHIVWDTPNKTLDIQSLNDFSGILQVNNGTVKINTIGNIGKAANATIEAFTDMAGVGAVRNDNFYQVAQRFQVSGAVYPEGILLTHIGIYQVGGVAASSSWATVSKEDGTVIANVNIPATGVLAAPRVLYIDLPYPIHIEPNIIFKINTKRGGGKSEFFNTYSGNLANGISITGGNWVNNANIDENDYWAALTANNTNNNAQILWGGVTFKFNPIPYKVIVNNGTLDLSALSVNDTYRVMCQTKINGGQILRKWLPIDNSKITTWSDFTDTETMYIPTTGQVRIVRSKVPFLNAQWYNNAGQIYNMFYRNLRLESDNVNNSSGKILRHYNPTNANSWGEFYIAQRLPGSAQQRRIFDTTSGNSLLGFHAAGDRGIYLDGSPNDYVIKSQDTFVQVFGTVRLSNGEMTQVNNRGVFQKWNISTAVSKNMSINWGAQRSTEWSDLFAVYGFIQTSGDLTELEAQTIRGFLSWHHETVTELENWHTFKNVLPTVVQTSTGITLEQTLGGHLANIPGANRTASGSWGTNHTPDFGFLGNTNSGATCWAANVNNNTNTWYQMDLGAVKEVLGVVVQARGNTGQFVSTYRVDISNNGTTFVRLPATYNGPTAWSDGNNANGIIAELPIGTTARYVRIVPVAFTSHKSLRADLIIK